MTEALDIDWIPFGAVVGREDDERVIGHAGFIQSRQHTANLRVHHHGEAAIESRAALTDALGRWELGRAER